MLSCTQWYERCLLFHPRYHLQTPYRELLFMAPSSSSFCLFWNLCIGHISILGGDFPFHPYFSFENAFFLTTKSRINPTSSNDTVTQPSVHFFCATNCSSYFFLSFLAVLKVLHKGTQPCLCCLLIQSKFLYFVRRKICTQ